MNLGKAIKEVREATGMTIEELEYHSSRAEQYLIAIENDTRLASNWDIEAIAEAFNTTPELLKVLAIEESDVPDNRKEIYKKLYPSVHDLTLELIIGKIKEGSDGK